MSAFSPLTIGSLSGTRSHAECVLATAGHFQSPHHRVIEWNKTIAASEWASNKALKKEWEEHRNDWVRQGVALSIKEFAVLQDELIAKARSKETAIFHFLHNYRPQLALHGRLRLGEKLLRDVALMYDIDKNERVGFYRRTLSNLKRQPEFVVIQGEE